MKVTTNYECPMCGEPAYTNLRTVECTNTNCVFYIRRDDATQETENKTGEEKESPQGDVGV